MVVVLGLFVVALLMMLGAVLTVLRARRLDHAQKVNKRLQSFSFIPEDGYKPQLATDFRGRLANWLARVGLQIQPGTALSIMGGGLTLSWLLWHVVNPLAGMLSAVLIVIGTVLVPQVRYQQRINKLVSQIPLFIDQVIRGLVTGRNIEGAIKLAMDDLRTPLREVIEKANQNVELGADLGDALREAAVFHDVKELHMLALAVQTSRTYGGSPREMLESVVNLIRQREQMQRELKAMTGETRVTAWVLGSLPTVMGAFMVYANPNYIGPMWDDPTGRVVLMVALAFQTLGALLLWRMVKSI
jgi:tight adherence protein B